MKKLFFSLLLATSIFTTSTHAAIAIGTASGFMNKSNPSKFKETVTNLSYSAAALIWVSSVVSGSTGVLVPLFFLDSETDIDTVVTELENKYPTLKGHSIISEIAEIITKDQETIEKDEVVHIVLSEEEVDNLFLRHGVNSSSQDAESLRELLITTVE
ncbi:MAG: hypothetical protein VX341_04930 [Bdellovibrionota bacterium]|nr:hypothetical protein [Bdellovibrionota bacterium]